MSLYEVLNLPVSFEAFYYSSEAWEKRKLEIEAEVKQSNAYIKMGNEVISNQQFRRKTEMSAVEKP
ncbi:hypothetical protein KXJ74_09025 [Acinetobacter johnsonii]|nr:hypothetical protein KXJ74_09025 [Acinetobacter johnsonii]